MPPPWDLGQEAWSTVCPAVGMCRTPGTSLPPLHALCGLARLTGRSGMWRGRGNSQPPPSTRSPHAFLLSLPWAWALCLGIRILDPSLRGQKGLGLFPSFQVLSRSIRLARPSLHTQPHGTPPPGHQVLWGKRSLCLWKLAAPGIPTYYLTLLELYRWVNRLQAVT